MPKKKQTHMSVGKRIKRIRRGKSVSLRDLANDTGQTIDNLKALESGEYIPPVGTILQISRALKIDSSALFRQKTQTRKIRKKAYAQRTDNYAYTPLTPGAENKHLRAFRVLVEPFHEHRGVGYCHEGEEFVHVLDGLLEVSVGDHVNHLKKGDSLHFNSGVRHCMKNPGAETTEMIVVVYAP